MPQLVQYPKNNEQVTPNLAFIFDVVRCWNFPDDSAKGRDRISSKAVLGQVFVGFGPENGSAT